MVVLVVVVLDHGSLLFLLLLAPARRSSRVRDPFASTHHYRYALTVRCQCRRFGASWSASTAQPPLRSTDNAGAGATPLKVGRRHASLRYCAQADDFICGVRRSVHIVSHRTHTIAQCCRPLASVCVDRLTL